MDGEEAAPEPEFALAMAFQPIYDAVAGRVFAYEALVRGRDGESAGEMLARVTPEARRRFDQQCRIAAIEWAIAAGILQTPALLAINFMPDVIDDPVVDSQRTLRAARETGLPPERLMFEFSENDRHDSRHIARVIEAYRKLGFTTAFDDFGGGTAGLGHLSRFTPHFLKLDPQLVRGLCGSWSRRLIVDNLVQLATGLGVKVIAEGVETREEFDKLRTIGVRYVQGYYIARPELGALPPLQLGGATRDAA